jgi:hypothetical protein
METIVNINPANFLKEDIKKIANEQKFLRNQKKTVHIVGERKLPAKDAAYKYMENSETLRVMYAAYGLMRGKSFSQTENHYPEENHPLNKLKYKIDALMSKYQLQEVEAK